MRACAYRTSQKGSEMKLKILGLLAVALLAAPITSNALALISIERISNTEAVITSVGSLGFIAPGQDAHFLKLLDPFATDPAPSATDSVLTASTLTVGGAAIDNARQVGTDFFPFPFLFLGSTTFDLPPSGSFAGSLHVTLTGSSTFRDVGSIGAVAWGSLAAGQWQVVAPNAAPEPSTLTLAALGFLGLRISRCRRRESRPTGFDAR